MTHRIPRSAIAPGFEVAVAAHALEMRNWRAHEAAVVADRTAGVEPAKRHVSYPRPSAHPMVLASVNENDAADYAIVEDGPTPAQILQAKKIELLGAVARAEADAIAAVVPAGKRRLMNLRENDIRIADSAFAASLMPRNVVGKVAEAVGIVKPIDVAALVEANRPAADTAFLADQDKRRAAIDAIERAAAKMQSDIEDLAPGAIDAWAMSKFPG